MRVKASRDISWTTRDVVMKNVKTIAIITMSSEQYLDKIKHDIAKQKLPTTIQVFLLPYGREVYFSMKGAEYKNFYLSKILS